MVTDAYGKEWHTGCEKEIDQYCRKHKLGLSIEYKTIKEKDSNCSNVWVITKVYFERTRETIIWRKDRYPISDEDLLLEIKKILRERKINQIL